MSAKTKQPIFILHGWTTDTNLWKPFISKLKKTGFSPTLMRIPGLTAPLDRAWNLDDYVSWFKHETRGIKNPIVIGHSFGGRIAIRYDIKNPNTIKKLILIDSAGIRPSSVASRFKRFSFETFAKIGKTITKNPKARNLLYKFAREQDYLQASDLLKQTMVNVISQDQKSEIEYIKAPTLIIWGAQDKTTPLSDGRYLHKHITGSTLKIIDDARHSPQYTHPDLVISYINDFIFPHK